MRGLGESSPPAPAHPTFANPAYLPERIAQAAFTEREPMPDATTVTVAEAPPIPAGAPECGALGRMGALVARLARSNAEIEAAQRLRHAVFVGECGASPEGRGNGREADALDAACDHLLVLDTELDGGGCGRVVGTYRLLRGEVAARIGGHYSDGEFDVAALLRRHPGRRFLELGRSCTLSTHRDRRTIELLWHGVWAYALRHRCDVMFGCASFGGLDPDRHAGALGFLARHALAEPPWAVPARAGVPLGRFAGRALAPRAALAALPPLLKGYLRLGGRVGPDLAPDPDFRCLDTLVVLPREAISPRYRRHYGEGAERFR